MVWPALLTNKIKQIVEATSSLWDILDNNTQVYAVFIKKDDNKRIFLAEKEKNLKVVRIFLSEKDALRFCELKSIGKNNLYVREMRYDTIYYSIIYIYANGTNIECRLTALDINDNIYDVEKVWSPITN